MMVIYNDEIRDPDTRNHPRMYLQGQWTNVSFSQKSTWPSGRLGSYFTVIFIIRILKKTWTLFEHDWASFSFPKKSTCRTSRIHMRWFWCSNSSSAGCKILLGIWVEHFYEFRKNWKIFSTSPYTLGGRISKKSNLCILKLRQSKFQASNYNSGQWRPKSKRGGQKMEVWSRVCRVSRPVSLKSEKSWENRLRASMSKLNLNPTDLTKWWYRFFICSRFYFPIQTNVRTILTSHQSQVVV